jgi:glycopeptide antibiotics resistance protein
LIVGGLLFLNRRRGVLYLFGLAAFCAYFGMVVSVMFFPIPVPDDWPANLSRGGMKDALSQINWIPFNYHIGGGIKADIRSGFRDVFLNVLLTVPIGLGFGYLFRKRWYLAFLAAPLVGLAFEGAQLFFKIVLGVFFHAVDMSDVVTNTAGVIIGAVIAWVIRAAVRFLMAPASRFRL